MNKSELVEAVAKKADITKAGDPTKSKTKLGWVPKYDLPALVKDMMSSDIKLMQKDKFLQEAGYKTLRYFE